MRLSSSRFKPFYRNNQHLFLTYIRKRSSDKEREFSTHFFGGGVSEKTVSSSNIGLSSSGHRESSNNRPGKAVRMASDNSSILSALSQVCLSFSIIFDTFTDTNSLSLYM
jgi:hypothetical protein